jgi:acetyl esterase/lipase
MNYRITVFIALVFVASCATTSVDPDRPLKPPKGYMNETFLKIAYGLGMLDLIDTKPEVPDDILELKDIEYKFVDSISLKLDIYKRKDLKKLAPVMIFIHGGAWRTGKRADYLPYLIDYAKKGYVTVTVSYRLVKQATFPRSSSGCKLCRKMDKNHAEEYGIDPDRIVLIGGSAGGHLSLMVGYGGQEAIFNQDCDEPTDSKVKVVIDLYGPTDLTTPYAIGTYQTQDFLGTTYDKNPEVFRMASPRTYISPDVPPTLIFQGTIDALVPVSQSDSLAGLALRRQACRTITTD